MLNSTISHKEIINGEAISKRALKITTIIAPPAMAIINSHKTIMAITSNSNNLQMMISLILHLQVMTTRKVVSRII